jgi:hypothetical protein
MSRMSYEMFTTRTADPAAYATPGIVNPTGTVYSDRFGLSETNALGFELDTTGTLTGTFSLQYSDAQFPDPASDTGWTPDGALTFTQPAGSATHQKYSVTDIRGRWFRVKYVHASGSGTLSGKAVSGE